MAKKRKPAPSCHYCDSPAEFLCDFVVECGTYHRQKAREGMTAAEFVEWMSRPDAVQLATCDRPLCARHRAYSSTMFWCGPRGFIETVDYCPGHANGPPEKPPFVPITGKRSA